MLWGDRGSIGGWYNPLKLWGEYCDGPVTGAGIPSGHFLAEEAPEAVLAWFEDFF